MVIDTHMHLSKFALGAAGYPAEVLRPKMEAEGVRGAWALTVEGCFGGDTRRWNDWLLEAVAPHRDFFVPFCTVDPKAGRAAVEELEHFVRVRGMRGLKIHNWLAAASTATPGMEELAAACGRLHVPLLVHDGTPPYCTPLQFARLAELNPDTTLILGHSGLKDMWPDALRAAGRLDNVYLCASAPHTAAVMAALRKVGASRIMFGSDCGPVDSERYLRERIHSIRALRETGVASRDIDTILHETALRLIPFPEDAPKPSRRNSR